MTSADRNDNFVTAQEKLEWITPKISLMDAEKTSGGKNNTNSEFTIPIRPAVGIYFGPS